MTAYAPCEPAPAASSRRLCERILTQPRTASHNRTPAHRHTNTPMHRSTVVPTPANQLASQSAGYLIIGRSGAETSTECLSPITFGSLMILSTTAFLSFICEAFPQMIV